MPFSKFLKMLDLFSKVVKENGDEILNLDSLMFIG
jgi:hypothetical protein